MTKTIVFFQLLIIIAYHIAYQLFLSNCLSKLLIHIAYPIAYHKNFKIIEIR